MYLFVLGFFSTLCHFDWTVKPVSQFSRQVNWLVFDTKINEIDKSDQLACIRYINQNVLA